MPAVKGDGMRGLAVFISDIRNCELMELVLTAQCESQRFLTGCWWNSRW